MDRFKVSAVVGGLCLLFATRAPRGMRRFVSSRSRCRNCKSRSNQLLGLKPVLPGWRLGTKATKPSRPRTTSLRRNSVPAHMWRKCNSKRQGELKAP